MFGFLSFARKDCKVKSMQIAIACNLWLTQLNILFDRRVPHQLQKTFKGGACVSDCLSTGDLLPVKLDKSGLDGLIAGSYCIELFKTINFMVFPPPKPIACPI